MRRSTVSRGAAFLFLCALAGCGARPSSESAASTATTRPALTGEELTRRTIERRAIEAINWGMPAVNEELMLQAMVVSAKGQTNQIVYWSRLPDWKIQTLTPNPDVIYVKPFFNTKDAGPMVLEIPPADKASIAGAIMDAWQTALEDVGPAGADKGKGGKYLILPPDYQGKAPAGYIALPSMTYQGYALLRSISASGSDADVAKAAEYGRRIKLYPLSQARKPPETTFVDAIDVVYDSTIPYDLRFFQSLDRIVQIEPWLPRDKVMIDLLKSIGIEKGQPFKPGPRTQEILNAAAREAKAWFDARYDAGFPAFYDGRRWAMPAVPDSIDGRGLAAYYAYSTTRHLGAGQYYLMAAKDKDGRDLDGSRSYRLTVPANVPVKQYWSATVYDRETHALIREVSRPSRSSQSQGLQKNTDGSVDIYFGPAAPAGRDTNWVPTKAGGRFEVVFRLYGPDKTFFLKGWQLPDIEEAK